MITKKEKERIRNSFIWSERNDTNYMTSEKSQFWYVLDLQKRLPNIYFMKDISFLIRSCFFFQTLIYPKAVLIPDSKQLPLNIIYIKSSFSPNQQYESVLYELLSIHINNIISIRKYYSIKVVTRNKPICFSNYS